MKDVLLDFLEQAQDTPEIQIVLEVIQTRSRIAQKKRHLPRETLESSSPIESGMANTTPLRSSPDATTATEISGDASTENVLENSSSADNSNQNIQDSDSKFIDNTMQESQSSLKCSVTVNFILTFLD